MKPRYASTLSLIFAFLIGGFFSLLPSSTPALSSNLPAGVILDQPASLNLTPNSLVRYSHTLLVSSNGSPTQNGTALLSARDIISNSNPSALNPYLLKLEPGQYDLGNQSLVLLPFVDLEGSGEDMTVISSTIGSDFFSPGNGTLIVVSNSETRFIKITNSGAAPNQIAVYVLPNATNNVHFTHLTTSVTGGVNNFGLGNNNGNLTLTNSTLNATGATNTSVGLGNIHNGKVLVQNSTLTATNGTENFGLANSLSNSDNLVIVQNSNLSATGGTTNFGLFNTVNGKVIVQNSNLSATGGTTSYGLSSNGKVTVQNSILTATAGITDNYGLSNGDTATVQNSTLTATGGTTSYGLKDVAGQAQVGASQLSGSTAASFGLTKCPASYNGLTFVLLNASCV